MKCSECVVPARFFMSGRIIRFTPNYGEYVYEKDRSVFTDNYLPGH